MSYSGTTTFNVSALQICTRAAAKLKIIDTSNGEVLDTNTYNDFLLQLNLLTKETMAVPGVIPWVRAYNILFTQQGQTTYSLGPTSTDNWSVASAVQTTTLLSAGNTGDGTISVNSITGFVSGQKIGIKLTSGLTFWTTINGTPSGSTITLTATLSGPAAAGNYVYAYTTVADRPQKILEMSRRNLAASTSQQDTIMDPISLQQYQILPNKLQTGTPLQWHFSNKIPNAELLIWQPYDGISGYDQLYCLCDTIIEDFVNQADNAYFPVEWANYLVFKLAHEMSYEYPVSMADRQEILGVANAKLNALLDYSSELSESPVQFGLRLGW